MALGILPSVAQDIETTTVVIANRKEVARNIKDIQTALRARLRTSTVNRPVRAFLPPDDIYNVRRAVGDAPKFFANVNGRPPELDGDSL